MHFLRDIYIMIFPYLHELKMFLSTFFNVSIQKNRMEIEILNLVMQDSWLKIK